MCLINSIQKFAVFPLDFVFEPNKVCKQETYNGMPYSYRLLTPIEVERLHGVPDNYTSCVARTNRYHMLGNGWSVQVIKHIFKNLKLSPEGRIEDFEPFSAEGAPIKLPPVKPPLPPVEPPEYPPQESPPIPPSQTLPPNIPPQAPPSRAAPPSQPTPPQEQEEVKE